MFYWESVIYSDMPKACPYKIGRLTTVFSHCPYIFTLALNAKKMKRIDLAIAVFAVLMSVMDCAASDAAHAGRAAVSGRIVNMTRKSAKTVTAIDCNPWSDGLSRHAVGIDSVGNFNTFVNLPYGHNFTVYYDGSFFCQYAEPGDSIHIVIDAANVGSGAQYSGSHAEFNNDYGKAYAGLSKFFYPELPCGQMPKEEFLGIFNEAYSGCLALIDSYADSVGLAQAPKDLLKRTALFSIANSALDHRDETPEQVLSFFSDSIFMLDCRGNLREMMFAYHLNAYLHRLENVVKPDSLSQMIDAIVARHPKSLNRDVMLGICLKDYGEVDDAVEIDRELFADGGIYESLCGERIMDDSLPDVELIDGEIYEWLDASAQMSAYTNLSEFIDKEFTGKIVYLDLWSTWCGPCIAAKQLLPDVAEFFRDKDVVFVSIALKSDFEEWKKLVGSCPDNCREIFIVSDDDAELIMSSFNMQGFPTYRILGRNSEVISSTPPKPSNPAIYDTLLRILQK